MSRYALADLFMLRIYIYIYMYITHTGAICIKPLSRCRPTTTHENMRRSCTCNYRALWIRRVSKPLIPWEKEETNSTPFNMHFLCIPVVRWTVQSLPIYMELFTPNWPGWIPYYLLYSSILYIRLSQKMTYTSFQIFLRISLTVKLSI